MHQPPAEVSIGLTVLFIRTVRLPKVNKTGNVHTNVLLSCLLANHYCSRKAISITYSECVSVALGIQHAMCMRHNCHLWPVWLNRIFPPYLTNGTIFKKKLLNTKCVF